MNKLDKQYTDLLQDILDNGATKQDRTGTGTISVFGRQIRHDMKDGFPLLTTKKMPWKTIVTELLWFLRGDTNIKYLVDNGCNIWNGDAYKNYISKGGKDFSEKSMKQISSHFSQEEFIGKIKTDDEFAKKWGELGPVYGKQWRSWEHNTGSTWEGNTHKQSSRTNTDQIQNLINDLKTNPDSRRLMVNAWNVGELDKMVLPPCHYGFQVYTRELTWEEQVQWVMKNTDVEWENLYIVEEIAKDTTPKRAISLMWNQRSVDTFLGLPFNIASYGLLLEIIAKEVNMVPDQLIGNLGDVHLYSNHIDAAKEQISRELTEDERYELVTQQMSKMRAINDEDYIRYNIPKRTREPFPLPTVELSGSWKFLSSSPCFADTIQYKDIELINYQSHSAIKAPLSN